MYIVNCSVNSERFGSVWVLDNCQIQFQFFSWLVKFVLTMFSDKFQYTIQVKLRHADQEIRLAQDPFPLYPGEVLKQVVTQLKVVHANTALRLRAVLDIQETDKTRRVAGDEWLFEGPGGFIFCIVHPNGHSLFSRCFVMLYTRLRLFE